MERFCTGLKIQFPFTFLICQCYSLRAVCQTIQELYVIFMACLFLNICNFFQALSGVGATIEDRANISDNDALSAALNAQFLFQIGVFTAVPMILGFILEQGFLRVCFLGPSHSLICYAKEVLFFYQT